MPRKITIAEACGIARRTHDEAEKRREAFAEVDARRTCDVEGHCAVSSGSDSLAHELAEPNGMLRYTITQQAKRLRKLADKMEEEGKCLKILGTTEKRIPHAFSRGAEMCGAADTARDWAANLEGLLPNNKISGTGDGA